MLESFLKIKIRRVIPTDTENIFSTLVFLESMWILWKEFLSSGLNCRFLNVWQFMYCPVVLMSPALSFEIKGKQRSNGAFVSPTILYSIRSVYVMRECTRTITWANSGLCGPFPLKFTPNSLPTLLPKLCPISVLQNARPDLSFVSWISIFCTLRDL